MSYVETEQVDEGLKFTTPIGLPVETTGVSLFVESNDLFVHEVVITEGVGEGEKFYLNLDAATPG